MIKPRKNLLNCSLMESGGPLPRRCRPIQLELALHEKPERPPRNQCCRQSATGLITSDFCPDACGSCRQTPLWLRTMVLGIQRDHQYFSCPKFHGSALMKTSS